MSDETISAASLALAKRLARRATSGFRTSGDLGFRWYHWVALDLSGCFDGPEAATSAIGEMFADGLDASNVSFATLTDRLVGLVGCASQPALQDLLGRLIEANQGGPTISALRADPAVILPPVRPTIYVAHYMAGGGAECETDAAAAVARSVVAEFVRLAEGVPIFLAGGVKDLSCRISVPTLVDLAPKLQAAGLGVVGIATSDDRLVGFSLGPAYWTVGVSAVALRAEADALCSALVAAASSLRGVVHSHIAVEATPGNLIGGRYSPTDLDTPLDTGRQGPWSRLVPDAFWWQSLAQGHLDGMGAAVVDLPLSRLPNGLQSVAFGSVEDWWPIVGSQDGELDLGLAHGRSVSLPVRREARSVLAPILPAGSS